MAELGFQVSTKTNDGTIFVIADAKIGLWISFDMIDVASSTK